MNIAIRSDASATIGSGHVMRCLTLAQACRRRGASVTFICRDHPGSLIELIRGRGFAVSVLPRPAAAGGIDLHWLGVSQEQDAAETHAAMAGLKGSVDWLVVDQYGIDSRWESKLRPIVARIMVIDDLADRSHDCDLLLDQNFRRTHEGRYAALVPEHCRLALGPHYALLQDEYALWRPRVSPRESVRHVLIYFGGVDAGSLTGKAIKAALSLDDLMIDAIVSSGDAHLTALRQWAVSQPRLKLHSGLPSLAGLVAASDLAVGAFGATSWERLCLGLPTIGVTLAANQSGVAAELSAADLAIWAGTAEAASEDKFAGLMAQVIRRVDLADWSRRCMTICDGQGAGRIADMLWTNRDDSTGLAEGTILGHL